MTIQAARISLANLNYSRSIASKIAFENSMERAMLNQKYWDELLEKLRKSGGGGGGYDKRFDRIAVSMQLIGFLSNKTIQALKMFRNFGIELFDTNKIMRQINNTNQIQARNIIQTIGKFIVGIVSIVSRSLPWQTSTVTKPISNALSAFAGILSLQLNRLKEILQDEFHKQVSKWDFKEKIKQMKEEVMNVVNFLKSCLYGLYHLKKSFPFN